MLYILSGTSRSGKTTVARRFLTKTGIPYMSVDAIMMGFTNGIPEYGIHDRLWPNEIAEKMWPFFKAMCDNMIWGEVDYLLEGEAFLPCRLRELVDDNPNRVQVAFMGYADAILAEKVKDVKQHSSDIGDWLTVEPDDYVESHIKNMIDYSAMIKAQCSQHGVPYFEMSTNFEDSVNNVLTGFGVDVA